MVFIRFDPKLGEKTTSMCLDRSKKFSKYRKREQRARKIQNKQFNENFLNKGEKSLNKIKMKTQYIGLSTSEQILTELENFRRKDLS